MSQRTWNSLWIFSKMVSLAFYSLCHWPSNLWFIHFYRVISHPKGKRVPPDWPTYLHSEEAIDKHRWDNLYQLSLGLNSPNQLSIGVSHPPALKRLQMDVYLYQRMKPVCISIPLQYFRMCTSNYANLYKYHEILTSSFLLHALDLMICWALLSPTMFSLVYRYSSFLLDYKKKFVMFPVLMYHFSMHPILSFHLDYEF